VKIVNKYHYAELFRTRLLEAMAAKSVSRSALARETGVHRSTLSQILDVERLRVPSAKLAADCASVLGVSADWLLGLTERPERPSDIIAAAMEVSDAPRALVDDQLLRWHQDAAGQKIRHVPATLPDMLKTPELIEWEYRDFIGRTSEQALGAMRDRLDWLKNRGGDYEIALSLYEVESMAQGQGYYQDLPLAVRRAQLDYLAEQCADFFPALRLFLYDSRRIFSAPLTVFGAELTVLYVGSAYLAFRETARVRLLRQHFDGLVRGATIDARDLAGYLRGLLSDSKDTLD
jgi:transcriptional regulator with XRE-family HTH domain